VEERTVIIIKIIYNPPRSRRRQLRSFSKGEIGDRDELQEMYSKFGWKWAVLAYMAARVLARGRHLPDDIVQRFTIARAKMENGCHSLCDIAADLRSLEIQLFPAVLHVGQGEVHVMLELIGKAMSGTIQENDIDLSLLQPVVADCTIPRVCLR